MTDTRFTLAEKGTDSSHDEVGFLVHKDIVSAVFGCRPVSSKLISIYLRAIQCHHQTGLCTNIWPRGYKKFHAQLS